MPRSSGKKFRDSFLPFVFILSFFVLVIFGVTFWHDTAKREEALNIEVSPLQGETLMQPWGTSVWNSVKKSTKLSQGDFVKTEAEGRSGVHFFDSVWMRLGYNSLVSFENSQPEGDSYRLSFSYTNGSLWFSTNPEKSQGVSLLIDGGYLRVQNQGTIFSLEDTAEGSKGHTVRVLDGTVYVDIVDPVNSRTVDTIVVSAGKQFVLPDDVYQSLLEYAPTPDIEDISEDFYTSDWYLWNTKLDQQKQE